MEGLYTFLQYVAGAAAGAVAYIFLVYSLLARQWLLERPGMQWLAGGIHLDVGPTERPFLKAFTFATVTYFVVTIWLSVRGSPISPVAAELLSIPVFSAFIAGVFAYYSPWQFQIWAIGGIYFASLVLLTLPNLPMWLHALGLMTKAP